MKSRPKWSLRKRRQGRSNTGSELELVDALAVHGVLRAEQLERAFERERARVERNHQCFSLAVFRLPEAKTLGSLRESMEETAMVLLNRIRTYDDVGIVDNGSLAVMLPETSGVDTWTFADGALDALSGRGLTATCEVYTYPHPGNQEERDASATANPSGAETDSNRDESFRQYGRVEHPVEGEAHLQNDDREADRDQARPGNSQLTQLHFVGGRQVHKLVASSTGRRADGKPLSTSSAIGLSAGSSALAPVALEASTAPPTGKTLQWPVHASTPKADSKTETRPIRDLAPYFEERLPSYRRAVDILVAGTALALVSPVLITAALLVKITSPGPIIFAQARAGRGGRPFQFYKLRSMYRDAEDRKNALRLVNEKDGPIFKIKNDPRITPVGKVLRKFSIDELPQLFNVLKGDMTLVGPRPPVLDEVHEYETWQRQRLDITGGITCIWQVSGRSEVTFREWMRMDVRYRKKRSLGLDLKLVWKTFGAVFSGKGAY